MRVSGKIRGRLALAILLTALIPLLVAVWLAETMLRQSSERFFVPELGARLDESLGLYQELARSVKDGMRYRADAMAAHAPLVEAVARADRAALRRHLEALCDAQPELVAVRVDTKDTGRLAEARCAARAKSRRGKEGQGAREVELEVRRPIGGPGPRESPAGVAAAEPGRPSEPDGVDPDEVPPPDVTPAASGLGAGPVLVAVFATDSARFGGLERMSDFVDSYQRVAGRRAEDRASYLAAFAALLGITLVAAIGVGALLARGVSSRLGGLAQAARRVGAGDLTVRVPEAGNDEITALSRSFNQMLEEVEQSRARIEYLQRIGAWQEMARRLAHEIKNPLTPIQLAVQEIHERYHDADPSYRKLLDTALEIVEEEVGTLRRLVTEFSDFARLPAASPEAADLVALLREERERASVVEPAGAGAALVDVELVLPEGPARAQVDRQLLHRVLVNLVGNAREALRDAAPSSRSGGVQPVAQRGAGRIRLELSRVADAWAIDVDDDGPGVPPDLRERIFDPYVTTKTDGTGLGLAIVKKIVVEHGGTISATASPLGGARVRVLLPALDAPSTAPPPHAQASGTPDGESGPRDVPSLP